MVSYEASSLEDIAAAFEIRAKLAEDRIMPIKSKKQQGELAAEVRIWREAAQMIRNTKLVGDSSS